MEACLEFKSDSFLDRRETPRYSVNFPIEIVAWDGADPKGEINGTVLNMSKGGLCLQAYFEAPTASLLFLSIELEGRDSLFLAEVVWRVPGPGCYRYGLRIRHWTYLDPQLERFIVEKKHNMPHAHYFPPCTTRH